MAVVNLPFRFPSSSNLFRFKSFFKERNDEMTKRLKWLVGFV